MKNKTIILLSIMLLFATGCGHNILTDYEVKGIDLSIPIGGYPFGVKIGIVRVNSNMVRGNATYSANTNVGTEIGTGATQKSTVIQFSSNAQINEGNVEKIMTSETVSDQVKETFVKEYLAEQQAPEVKAVTSKTPTAVTVVGDNPKLHKNVELQKQESILSMFTISGWIQGILAKMGDFFVMTAAGKLIMILVECLAGLIILLFVIDIIKKIVSLISRKIKSKKQSKIDQKNLNITITCDKF